ncbi:MAG: DMT family transporter [bacterium]
MAVFLLMYYLHHAKQRAGVGPDGSQSDKRTIVFVALFAVLSVLAALLPIIFVPLSGVVILVLLFVSARSLLSAKIDPVLKAPALGWQFTYFLLALSLTTGAALLPVYGLARHKIFFATHRYATIALFAAFLISLLFQMRIKRERIPHRHLQKIGQMLIAIVIVGGVFLLLIVVDRNHKNPAMTYSMSTIPLEQRPPEDRFPAPFPGDIARMLMATRSCAANPGCHQAELADFEISNHYLSVRTPHFIKNIDLLAEEIGKDNQLLCAGCHYPYMMFSGEKNLRHKLNQDGFSCAYCHQISSVRLHPTNKRISYITVEPQTAHLSSFYNPGAPDTERIGRWDETLIKLNPNGHGRVFKRPLYSRDIYCQSCHGLQIVSPASVGLERNTCIRCHMQPRYYLGWEGTKKNHFFPGANATVAYELGYDKSVKMIQAWMRGDIAMDIPSVKFWTLRKKPADRSDVAFWLFLNIVPLNKPKAGEVFHLNMITSNVGIDHQFPAAPLDLVEGWLQVKVVDAEGRIVYELGKLNEEHRLADDYPLQLMLGGYMLDSRDHLLVRNRVWDIKQKVVRRNIKPGETQRDKIEFAIPADAASPLTITAQWNYRTHNQAFVEWGFLEDGWSKKRPRTAPVVTVGSIKKEIELF